jgi:Thiamine pyrophosphate-requiring enzymes [acetolactate synthase, pyruvate dehydrogenase (cytochrome), glyoxylate carboligase, phosphonopyruvate decarboxylase]
MVRKTVAELIVECLENEGVKYAFGIPGEENIQLVDALNRSKIKFILVRHEQGAAFMADLYGRVTGIPGVCIATLGPGALNLVLGVADAELNTTPIVAISAQGGLNRIHKESHQVIDLVSLFKPITQFSRTVLTPQSVPELVRKAFSVAKRNKPGASYLSLPQDVEKMEIDPSVRPIPVSPTSTTMPTQEGVDQAVRLIQQAKHPIILAGNGVVRKQAETNLVKLSQLLNIPVATTFEGKGVISDRLSNALGVVGFMRHDYGNFAFDRSDLIITVGFSIQQFDPVKINPDGDKKIIHINTFKEDTDSHYNVTLNIVANINASLASLISALTLKDKNIRFNSQPAKIKTRVNQELEVGATDDHFPLKPQKVVYETRKALRDDDIALVDTGAVKMWMARLYPTYQPQTCIIDNGLSTMGWTLPGAIGVKLARPDQRVVAIMGDGSFLMNSQEIETAVREHIHLVTLIWEDNSYGLIKWKMDLELDRHSEVDFTNPDFVQYAESFGAKGYRIRHANELKPALETALNDTKHVHVIVCPVDYSENMKLIAKLGDTTISF